MSSRRRRRRAGGIDGGGLGSWLKRWIIPAVGAVTPILLIVVNIAAFIVHHLSSFQWLITILAFVSGEMLNTWVVLKIYRALRRRFPLHSLFHDRNEELVLVGGMLVVTVASFVSAYFCYQGLANERNLPNWSTFLAGAISIAMPIVLQVIFRSIGEREASPASPAGVTPRRDPSQRGDAPPSGPPARGLASERDPAPRLGR